MSRSFVVGKRSSRVVFGRFCAEAVVNEQTTIAIEREKKRQSIFIKQRERSEQSAVERIGCNSDFIPRLDAVPWRIGFKVNWEHRCAVTENFAQPITCWRSLKAVQRLSSPLLELFVDDIFRS